MFLTCQLKRTFAALCLLASAAASATTVQVGVVQSVSPEHLILAQKDGTAYLGFIASGAALRSLKTIKKGQEVRAVFSASKDARTNVEIGTLLAIRVCLPLDAECAADRKQAGAEPAQQAQCLQAMQHTLDQDPRFGPPIANPAADALATYNSLTGEQRTCASKFAGDFHAAFMEACDQHHCGDQLAGGCAHLAGRTLHADFHDKALAACRGQTQ